MPAFNTFVQVAMTVTTALTQPLVSSNTEVRTEPGAPFGYRTTAHRTFHLRLPVEKRRLECRNVPAIISSRRARLPLDFKLFRVQDGTD
jgi:hypothetical protein